MNRMWSKLKLIGGVSSLVALMVLMACGQQFLEPFDSEEQLEIDIELIEAYIAEKGYTDYDTSDTEIRFIVLDPGTGSTIEPEDIVSFNYVGIYLNDTIFDTSIPKLAYDQDTINTVGDIIFKYDDNEDLVYDVNGFARIDTIEYASNYRPIYNYTRDYTTFKTTHTQTGWFTEQLYPSFLVSSNGYIPAFASTINYAMFNVKIGGRILALIPSALAYGQFGNSGIPPNTVLMFEIRPASIR